MCPLTLHHLLWDGVCLWQSQKKPLCCITLAGGRSPTTLAQEFLDWIVSSLCVCVYICSLFSAECSSSDFLGRWLSTTSRAECVRVFHLCSPAHFSLSGGVDDSPVAVITLGEMLVQPGEGLSLVHPDHLPFPLSPCSFFLWEKYLLSFNRRENNHVRWVVFPFSIPMRCLGALPARWDSIFFSFSPSPAPWAQFHVTAPSEDSLLQEVAGTFLPLPCCGNPALEQPQGSDSS